MQRFARLLAASFFAAVLSGCAGGFLLDSQVQTYSHLTAVPSPATYRFDRLPSQVADPAQASLEAMADPALHKAGWRRDDAAPRYSVQVSGRVQRMLSPYADPWDSWGSWGWGLSSGGIGIGFGRPFGRMESPWYRREVTIIVREIASNQVVYETRATNEGPWLDNRSVLPAMFEAAMHGFPNPPQGPRRIDIHVGAQPA